MSNEKIQRLLEKVMTNVSRIEKTTSTLETNKHSSPILIKTSVLWQLMTCNNCFEAKM